MSKLYTKSPFVAVAAPIKSVIEKGGSNTNMSNQVLLTELSIAASNIDGPSASSSRPAKEERGEALNVSRHQQLDRESNAAANQQDACAWTVVGVFSLFRPNSPLAEFAG